MDQKGEWPNVEGGGMLEGLYHAAGVMFGLGSYLMPSNEKIRITIECDPETERYTIKREVLR